MDWRKVYAAYPINARQVWLNNCGITPAGKHIVARMAAHFERMAQFGPGANDASPGQLLDDIRQKLAQLLCAEPSDIALVHNTAEGMTMVSLGLTLNPGDEILLLENEYPSNVYPWEHWADHGVQLHFVPMARTADEFLENFRDALKPRTKVAALSMVHWCTGLRLPIEPIAAMCRDRGILLVLDGSQGVGQVPLDFRRVAPAVLCFSAWKWLLGPLGLGALVIDRATLATLHMPFKGTDSVADPESYLPYQTQMRASVDRYTYSTANYNDWVYFDESLAFLQELGFDNVQARILELTERLWQGLSVLGFESAYVHTHPRSGILCVRKAGVDMDALCSALTAQGFIARVRLGHLRLAPHVYQSPEQMDSTVAAIRELASR